MSTGPVSPIHITSPSESISHATPTRRATFAFLLLIGVVMFVIELTGYPNLVDNERRIGAYVLDAVQNGHWMIQKDVTGAIASKPPLLTWIAAVVTLLTGEISRFAIYLPSALATIGVALLLFSTGQRYFGWAAGFLSAMVYILSPSSDQQMMTARYDGLLALPVTFAALAAFRAWKSGEGWLVFWLAAAVGTLTKGPIAIVLPAGGLLAHWWEKRSGHESRLKGSHWLGVAVYFLICGGWFLLAYLQMGQPVLEKMLGRELLAHATGAGRETEAPLAGFYEPSWNFLAEFAPWSILACLGFWRIVRHPDADPDVRRLERFVFCWFFLGLLLFSIVAHQRGRLIFPLLPAAALIAGREAARLLHSWSAARMVKVTAGVAVLIFGFLVLYHHVLFGRSNRVQKTLGMGQVARQVKSILGPHFPLVHVDTPFTLQFYLSTAWPLTSFERAAELLRSDCPSYVAVSSYDQLMAQFHTNAPALYDLAVFNGGGESSVRVVGNRPNFDPSARMATLLGPFRVQFDGFQFVARRDAEIRVRLKNVHGTLSVKNQTAASEKVRIRCLAGSSGRDAFVEEKILEPDEVWTITR